MTIPSESRTRNGSGKVAATARGVRRAAARRHLLACQGLPRRNLLSLVNGQIIRPNRSVGCIGGSYQLHITVARRRMVFPGRRSKGAIVVHDNDLTAQEPIDEGMLAF